MIDASKKQNHRANTENLRSFYYRTVEDNKDWLKWLNREAGIGVNSNESWEVWWREEYKHLEYTGVCGRIMECVLSLRFFLFQFGVVYHMDVTGNNRTIGVSQNKDDFDGFLKEAQSPFNFQSSPLLF